MTHPAEHDVRDASRRWDEAMVGNDPAAIGAFMADDWTIVGTDGSVGGKARFLSLIASGDLSHDVMATEDMHVRVYGDTAVTIAKGTSGGRYQGTPFLFHERVSCVFVKHDGRWLCVSTHLTSLADASSEGSK